ncbi:transporter substrate-binding domain-containing protein [Zavarzinia sp.]|uniref:transporter substrate-binding domain-containing protein n=1 Tax=Zavarzinia sp. TaxID=2027920 RepID=UPI003BB5624A
MSRILPALLLWLPIVLGLAATPARADALADIRARGELIAGVKADYEPFGYRGATGDIIGFDADVAADLAAAIGVPVRLVAVTSANRLQKLAAGEIDVVVATLGDTIDRRRLVRMIEPGYYGGGASVLLPGDSPIRDWASLRGAPLCAVQGALWNRLAAARLLADIRAFGNPRDAELALRDRACAGWLYDEAALQHRLASGDWPGYRLLPADFVAPWAIAVASEGPLARRLDETVAGWLRDGHLLALEAKWRLPPSTYLREAGRLWSAKGPDGQWRCRRDGEAPWPAECRDLNLIEAQDLRGIGAAILSLRDDLGIDLTPFYDPYSRDLFLRALATTALLAVLVVIGSLITGLCGAMALRWRLPLLTPLVSGVLTGLRMTPPLLQLYLVFFGLGGVIAAQGVSLGALAAAVIVLSLYAGAANAVALAEAAASITAGGDRRRRIAALAYPAVMGSCINIVKATAMASAIAVPELVHASTAIITDYGNGGVMMNILLGCYVVLVLIVVQGFTLFERKVLRR